MKKTILRRTNVNGVDYLLPKHETDYSSLKHRNRGTKTCRVPNSDFAEFIEMGILIALFAAVMVLSAF